MAHVVTKLKTPSFGFKELQVTMANMRYPEQRFAASHPR